MKKIEKMKLKEFDKIIEVKVVKKFVHENLNFAIVKVDGLYAVFHFETGLIIELCFSTIKSAEQMAILAISTLFRNENKKDFFLHRINTSKKLN